MRFLHTVVKRPSRKSVDVSSNCLSIIPMNPGFCVSASCIRKDIAKICWTQTAGWWQKLAQAQHFQFFVCPADPHSTHIWARDWQLPTSHQALPEDSKIFKPLVIISSSILHCSSYFSLLDTWIGCEGGFHTFKIIFPLIVIYCLNLVQWGAIFKPERKLNFHTYWKKLIT